MLMKIMEILRLVLTSESGWRPICDNSCTSARSGPIYCFPWEEEPVQILATLYWTITANWSQISSSSTHLQIYTASRAARRLA